MLPYTQKNKELVMNKKIFTITATVVILALISAFALYRENVVRLFRQSVSLNYYCDVFAIKLGGTRNRFSENPPEGYFFEVKITNVDDIKRIMSYLNSLELIEANPRRINHVPDLREVGFFWIRIIRDPYENNLFAHDALSFRTNYLIFTPDGRDWESRVYYIRNSGYDPTTQNSRVFLLLLDVINAREE